MKLQTLRSLLISCLALFTLSCKNVFEQLGEKNCTDKSTTPAGPNKRVLLFAQNHIYVVGPGSLTRHPVSRSPWKNSDLVTFRSKQISNFFPLVNNILKDNSANIYVQHSGYDIRVVTQDKIRADMDNYGAKGKTGELVTETINDPEGQKYIHLHWLWTSTSSLLAVGIPSARSIVIGDDPSSGSRLRDTTLAHEFVHALGYDTHVSNDPSNLMNDDSIGTKLNQQQLQIIWTDLNRRNDKLLKLSCDK